MFWVIKATHKIVIKINSQLNFNWNRIRMGTRSVDVNLHRVHFKAEVASPPPISPHSNPLPDATNQPYKTNTGIQNMYEK